MPIMGTRKVVEPRRKVERGIGVRGPHGDGLFKCYCWCRTAMIKITKQELLDCKTRSCGRERCKDPTTYVVQ